MNMMATVRDRTVFPPTNRPCLPCSADKWDKPYLAGGIGAHIDRSDLVQLVAHAGVDIHHLEIPTQAQGVMPESVRQAASPHSCIGE